ncbi:hypothetical protein SporoP37_13355 [Sporosarcina sp. P37]|uniref:hypothetical protein n=1 Tax=unclassified Sporosarcina TaxID=2647733 RepID=UPI000A17C478|nr:MULTISPECIES: hypothetical protein [unclassified Sporosarcina]ARK25547.1 hypothetical protein SporoP37_13355 [Sporosarcina sp. P37]PID17757.1 hypothetical protein CSV62_11845 [Sporosarcina sp. P35]
MPVTQYYPIGSITMPSSWIAVAAGFIVTYLFIRLCFGKIYSERIGNIFFYVVMTWKLSVILTDFSMVIRHPLSLLYFHGGTFGWILGLTVAALLTLKQAYQEKWKRIDQWTLLLALITWQVIYQTMMAVLNQGSLAVKSGTVILFLGVLVLAVWSERKAVNTVSELSVIFIALHLLVSSFQPGPLVHNALITTGFIGLLMWGTERVSAQSDSRREEVE